MIKRANKNNGSKNVPDGWAVRELGDLLVKLSNGLSYDTSETVGLPVTRIETISSGVVDLSRVGHVSCDRDIDHYRMEKGDLLFSHINSLLQIGKVAYYDSDSVLYHGMNLLLLRCDKSICSKYLYYLLMTPYMKYVFRSIAKPAVNQASISTSDLKRVNVILPILWEQEKIVNFIDLWDIAIEKQTALIEKLRLRKRALMQQLLTGKKRLPGFTDRWKTVKLREVFSERNETNCNDLPLLSITGDRGVIYQNESERRDISNDDKSKYKRICPNDIGYNTMRMWQGRSALSLIEGIVSPAYTIVTPKKTVDVRFMSMLIKLPHVVHKFWEHSQGLVSDTLNCKFPEFCQVKVTIPSKKEQAEIANMISVFEDQLKLENKKLLSLQSQKRGLMQQLLTGKKRIKRPL
jgi:type I restriction enzyme S subunit